MIARKFAAALAVGILLVQLGSAGVRVYRETRVFRQDVARDALHLGRALAHGVQRTWKLGGQAEALGLVDLASARETRVTVRWIAPHALEGDPYAPLLTEAAHAAMDQLESREELFSDEDGNETVVVYVPVRTPEGSVGAIEVSDPLIEEWSYVRASILSAGITATILVGLSALLAWLLGAALIGRPIQVLVAQAQRVGRGDLSQRLDVQSRDEIGQLAAEMNEMVASLSEARQRVESETSARLAALEQLRHADRLTTIGTLASGVAHELGTPINVVAGYAQLINEDPQSPPAVRESTQVISRQCKRMERIIRQLLDFSRRAKYDDSTGVSDLRVVVSETLRMLEPLLRKSGAVARFEPPEQPVNAAIDFGRIQQVLTNIMVNGVHAMPEGGTLTVTVTDALYKPPGEAGPSGEFARITVRDSGVGMDEEAQRRAFEPFFTTKEVGEGTGLGLAVSHGIVADHGGWIEVDSTPGKGTTFAIYLPAGAAA